MGWIVRFDFSMLFVIVHVFNIFPKFCTQVEVPNQNVAVPSFQVFRGFYDLRTSDCHCALQGCNETMLKVVKFSTKSKKVQLNEKMA